MSTKRNSTNYGFQLMLLFGLTATAATASFITIRSVLALAAAKATTSGSFAMSTLTPSPEAPLFALFIICAIIGLAVVLSSPQFQTNNGSNWYSRRRFYNDDTYYDNTPIVVGGVIAGALAANSLHRHRCSRPIVEVHNSRFGYGDNTLFHNRHDRSVVNSFPSTGTGSHLGGGSLPGTHHGR